MKLTVVPIDCDFRFPILVRDPKERFAVELNMTTEKREVIKLEILTSFYQHNPNQLTNSPGRSR
jgi:hypothetical protein